MQYEIYTPEQRGVKDQGWLRSNFTFSFSSYYNPARSGFGLLRTFNDDFVEPGRGFGLHPHTNMEIISIMLAGSMNHIDSLGYKETVTTDWVQVMSAGSGLRHEEHNVGQDVVNFLQIWIEPKLQNITPRYQRRFFPEKERLDKLVTVVSNEEGQSHCWINQNARISLGHLGETKSVEYTFNPLNKGLFVFVVSGGVRVNGVAVGTRHAIGLWDSGVVRIDADQESRFVVIEVPVNH